jgi:hypothetical protein
MTYRKVTIVKPQDLSADDLEQIYRLVRKGRAVDRGCLKPRIHQSHAIAFIKASEPIICVGAIKNPSASHLRGIASDSGYVIASETRELGYVVTEPGYVGQGLAKSLCRMLVDHYSGPLFATTSDPAMRHIFAGLNWNCVGSPWRSNMNPDSLLTLWVHGIAE